MGIANMLPLKDPFFRLNENKQADAWLGRKQPNTDARGNANRTAHLWTAGNLDPAELARLYASEYPSQVEKPLASDTKCTTSSTTRWGQKKSGRQSNGCRYDRTSVNHGDRRDLMACRDLLTRFCRFLFRGRTSNLIEKVNSMSNTPNQVVIVKKAYPCLFH